MKKTLKEKAAIFRTKAMLYREENVKLQNPQERLWTDLEYRYTDYDVYSSSISKTMYDVYVTRVKNNMEKKEVNTWR